MGLTATVVVGNPKAGSRTRTVAEALVVQLADDWGDEPETAVIELSDLASELVGWGSEPVAQAKQVVLGADLLVVASPVFKASYTGLLKAFLDQFGRDELNALATVPLMVGAGPDHSLAVEAQLRPVLIEIGASCPTRGVYVLEGQVAEIEAVLRPWIDQWGSALRGGHQGSIASAAMAGRSAEEARDGVPLTNLDQPLFDGADATKRDLVDYLDGVRDRILPQLADRPLSVIRVHRGEEAFMQKNVPKYAPEWIQTVQFWAEASKRNVSYALCNDRRTLLWFANQRAVEYHPTLVLAERPDHMTHLVLDLDPPEAGGFAMAVRAAHLVHDALTAAGLDGAVKTSGAKGVHVFVPIADDVPIEDAAAATRAIAARAERLDPGIATTAFMKEDRGGKVFVDSTRVGGATVVAAYSPRVRPGVPVSFPLRWSDLDDVTPRDFTITSALAQIGDADPWLEQMPAPQALSAELVEEGHAIPVARVQAMHEGKRRARARARKASG